MSETRDLRPTSGKAEFHLTYACDLECMACNRASFLRKPHTEPMTLEDAEEFYRQADELSWKPRIILIGGEPTLHRDFSRFLQRAIDWSGQDVQVFSNGYSPTAQRALRFEGIRGPVSVARESLKPEGSVMRNEEFPAWTDDVFVSPADFGKPVRAPCYQHASIICGVDEIIWAREGNARATIITTNLMPDDLRARCSDRIVDRLRGEWGSLYVVPGASRRRKG